MDIFCPQSQYPLAENSPKETTEITGKRYMTLPATTKYLRPPAHHLWPNPGTGFPGPFSWRKEPTGQRTCTRHENALPVVFAISLPLSLRGTITVGRKGGLEFYVQTCSSLVVVSVSSSVTLLSQGLWPFSTLVKCVSVQMCLLFEQPPIQQAFGGSFSTFHHKIPPSF